MRTLPPVEPGQVWFVDFDPVRGREQGRDRPALVVSSRFHLEITGGQLICVVPLTSVERPGWLHRVHVAAGSGWVITEQILTISVERFRRPAPKIQLSAAELREAGRILTQMLLIAG
ncbi:MAG: type II toxin-antitoxin system PemK/MazF family toxin [Mycobacterium sp.]|nr:type II toxin-antitoxin system PemK/MazF family toxin [Mycobacterium sp.]